MTSVSVVMPYYKKKDYIKSSVFSVLKQSFKNFEILIVYDNDTNDDINFIKKIKKLDNRIKIIYNNKNIGAGPSRNLAIKKAKGKFIAFLDCDDLWFKNKLKFQIKFMTLNKLDFSYTAYQIIDASGKVKKVRKVDKNLNFKTLLRSCDIGLSTVIIKKNIFTNFYKFANLKTKEDYVLWLKLFKKNFKISGLNLELTKWRKIDGSLSSNTKQKIIDGFLVYYKFMKFNLIKSFIYLVILSINYIFKKY